jgi:hypothetical protein
MGSMVRQPRRNGSLHVPGGMSSTALGQADFSVLRSGRDVPHEVDAAALPGAVRCLEDRRLDAFVGVGGDQLDAAQTPPGQASEEVSPDVSASEGPTARPRTSRRPSVLTPTASSIGPSAAKPIIPRRKSLSPLFSISPRRAIAPLVIFGPWFRLSFATPTLPKIADDHRCGAHSLRRPIRVRFASGSANGSDLHHAPRLALLIRWVLDAKLLKIGAIFL